MSNIKRQDRENVDIAKVEFSPELMRSLREVERIIGYEFNDLTVLRRALTHIGYSMLHDIGGDSYQRMEYLGDSILDFVVADELFHKYPEYDEGKMTKIRANVVSKTPLAKIIVDTGLVKHILYDDKSTTLSEKLKSDIFESIVAAIYLDSNSVKASRAFILRFLRPVIKREATRDVSDYKSMLYEFASQHNMDIRFVEEGTEGMPHDLTFYISLYIDGVQEAKHSGKSKREAEKKCSQEALKKLGVI